MKCVICMSVQLNILCLICINLQYPQNCTEFNNDAKLNDTMTKTFDILHAFLSLVIAKFSYLKNSPFFAPACMCN